MTSLELAIVLFGIGISGLVSWRFGDWAGTKAAQKFEEKKAIKASILALKALENAVELAGKLAKFNMQATINSGVVKMPVGMFEAAFISGDPILDASKELIDTVNAYLSQAYAVNAIIDIFLGHLSGSGSQSYAERQLPNIQEGCTSIPEVLEKLQTQLKLELKSLEAELNKLQTNKYMRLVKRIFRFQTLMKLS